MINTIDKAKRVQKRRNANGLRGLAMAVKRFLKRAGLDTRSLA